MTPDRRDVAGWRCSEAVAIAPSSRIPIPPDFGRAPWRLLNISGFVATFQAAGRAPTGARIGRIPMATIQMPREISLTSIRYFALSWSMKYQYTLTVANWIKTATRLYGPPVANPCLSDPAIAAGDDGDRAGQGHCRLPHRP